VRKVVEAGLAEMCNEAPNGEHRRKMIGDYGATGCGIFVNGGEVMLA
jgi:hypothetical protein